MALRISELSKLWLIPNAPQAARAFSVNVVTGFSSVAPSSAARGPGLFCLAPLLKNSHSFKGRVKTFPVPFLSSLPLPFSSSPRPPPPLRASSLAFSSRQASSSEPVPRVFKLPKQPTKPRHHDLLRPLRRLPRPGFGLAAHDWRPWWHRGCCTHHQRLRLRHIRGKNPRRFTLGPPTGIPPPQGLTTRRGQNQAGQNSGWGQRPRGSENGDSVVDFGLVILEDARLGTR